MKSKILKISAIIFIAIAIVLPITFFIIIFNKQYLSDNIEDWGNFGDYLWQYFSIIIAGLNLFIFYAISKSLSKQNFILAEISIRQSIISNFVNYFNSKFESQMDFNIKENYNCIIRYIESYRITNAIFFDFDRTSIIAFSDKTEWCRDNIENLTSINKEEFINLKDNFITELNIQIKTIIIENKR